MACVKEHISEKISPVITSSESGESGLSEDEDSEEHDNRELVTTQTARSSQKMAFEVRISQHRVLISQLMVT